MTDGPLKEGLLNILYYICILSGCSNYSGKGLIDAVDEVANVNRMAGRLQAQAVCQRDPTLTIQVIPSFEGFTSCLWQDANSHRLLFTLSMGMEARVSCGPIRHPKRPLRLLKTAFPQNFRV